MMLHLKRILILGFLFSLFFPFSVSAKPSQGEFQTQISKTVASFLKQRQGIVFLFDLQNSSPEIYGDIELAHQLFLPGSVMKLLVAEAGIESAYPHFECKGRLFINGKRLRCWTGKGHGNLELPRALALSCNLYFIQWAQNLGAEKLLEVTQKYFLISKGLKNKLEENNLDLGRFAIGDFPEFRVSPQSMADFWRQYLQKLETLPYAPIRQGLLRAVEEGTARKGQVSDLMILGKTGTADALSSQINPSTFRLKSRSTLRVDTERRLNPNLKAEIRYSRSIKTHGWFLGAAPALHPRFAVVIFLKNAYGFEEAARLGAKIFEQVRVFEFTP